MGTVVALSKRPNANRPVRFREKPLSEIERRASDARIIRGLKNAGLLIDEIPTKTKREKAVKVIRTIFRDTKEIARTFVKVANGTYQQEEFMAVHGPIPEEVRRNVAIVRD